jgi:hypothetical protein
MKHIVLSIILFLAPCMVRAADVEENIPASELVALTDSADDEDDLILLEEDSDYGDEDEEDVDDDTAEDNYEGG